jgi:predicted RNA binding protein YcfA (HicA-like mRNA interferase family)
VKPADLIRRLNRLARLRDWEIKTVEGGSHSKVTLNGRRTTIGRHAADLKTGTFRGILKQLGLTETDLEV